MVFRHITREGIFWKFDLDAGRQYRISATKTGEADAELRFTDDDNNVIATFQGTSGPRNWVSGKETHFVNANVSRVPMSTQDETHDSDQFWSCSFRKDQTGFSFTIELVR